jgi:NADH-quinone oxidoreductase subunit J
MTASFLVLAALTIAGTAAAMGLRNLVHSVLALTLGFAGLAALYLQLDAEFVGFTQVLVYVGAVAILAVFAIMMTRSVAPVTRPAFSSAAAIGGAVAGAVFAVLAWAIHCSIASPKILPNRPEVAVRQVGDALMHKFVLPLEIMGLLLTVALIGAVLIAMQERGQTP